MSPSKIRVTVLISGSGTNLQALIDASLNDSLPINIIRVISNKKDAYGLQRATNAGIPTLYHNIIGGGYRKKFGKDNPQEREEYDKDLASLILEDKPELVVCAGWMHILSAQFLNPLEKANLPIINLHPALPGAYDGAGAIERAHKDFMARRIEKMGIMIHYVVQEVDRGEPIVVREIPLEHPRDDDIHELEERVHKVEHVAIVDGTRIAISKILERRAHSGQQ